jgi:hypothetical protein
VIAISTLRISDYDSDYDDEGTRSRSFRSDALVLCFAAEAAIEPRLGRSRLKVGAPSPRTPGRAPVPATRAARLLEHVRAQA